MSETQAEYDEMKWHHENEGARMKEPTMNATPLDALLSVDAWFSYPGDKEARSFAPFERVAAARAELSSLRERASAAEAEAVKVRHERNGAEARAERAEASVAELEQQLERVASASGAVVATKNARVSSLEAALREAFDSLDDWIHNGDATTQARQAHQSASRALRALAPDAAATDAGEENDGAR